MAELPKDESSVCSAFLFSFDENWHRMRTIMKTDGVMKIFIYGLVSLTLALTSCGGGGSNGGNTPIFFQCNW